MVVETVEGRGRAKGGGGGGAFVRARNGSILNRHGHRLEGGIAIDEVDALLHDAKARAVAAQAMMLRPAKTRCCSSRYSAMITVEPTTYSPLPSSTDSTSTLPTRCGALWRLLHVDARMLKPLVARQHRFTIPVVH